MKKKKSGLGKGLGALLTQEDIYEAGSPGFFLCPIEKIKPNPLQPRQSMDDHSLDALAKSIKDNGILQPLVVSETDSGYELIAGERRWRAAQRAGLRSVPVVIKNVSPSEALELALIENIQREDLNPLEEAQAYERLINEFGLTQSQVAAKVGKKRSTVANALRLLQLPDYVKEDLADGILTPGHARAILSLETPELQRMLRDAIIDKELSVRQAETLARSLAKSGGKPKMPPMPDPDIQRLCEELSEVIGAQVSIKLTKKGGRLQISCTDPEQFEKIIEQLKALS